jgi:FKBP-type peptidyl-prolyl cis-trans isomerase
LERNESTWNYIYFENTEYSLILRQIYIMKKIRYAGLGILFLSLIGLLNSCSKSTLSNAELLDKEQKTLQQYISANHITTTPTSSGLYYMPTDTGSGDRPDTNDVVEFTYTLRLLNGKVLATNIDSVATANQLGQSGVFYRPFKYRITWWFDGLKEGFQLMRAGGKASFIIPSSLAYGPNGVPSLNIAGYTTVIFDIRLINVIHDPLAYEKAQILKYIADSIPESKQVDILDSGVYHITDVAGTGDYPANYKTVTVRYTARLIDGTFVERISNNEPPFSYKLNTTQVIPGFDIAIRKMKKGEKGWIIIPYKQAYGEKPAYYVNFPPFTTLVYYLTIVDIQ